MRSKILLTATFLIGVSYSFASTITIAVKRGQERVEMSVLPLACIGIATDHAALPLDTMTLEDLATHKEIKAILSKTFGNSHPELLTALGGSDRSLSLAILHLNAGQYRIKTLEFVGPSRRHGFSTIAFDLTHEHVFSFTVKSGCANYTGTLVISASWASIPSVQAQPGRSAEAGFSCELSVEQTAVRDVKWARDVVPGMHSVPPEVSPLEDTYAKKTEGS